MKHHWKNRLLCNLMLLTGSCYRFEAWLKASLMPRLTADLQFVIYLCIPDCASAEELKAVNNLQL